MCANTEGLPFTNSTPIPMRRCFKDGHRRGLDALPIESGHVPIRSWRRPTMLHLNMTMFQEAEKGNRGGGVGKLLFGFSTAVSTRRQHRARGGLAHGSGRAEPELVADSSSSLALSSLSGSGHTGRFAV